MSWVRWAKVREGTWFGSTKSGLTEGRRSKELFAVEVCISLSESEMLLLLLPGLMIMADDPWGELENMLVDLMDSCGEEGGGG